MAKKILSILCALAMMVTMVSVAAFSASAAEPVAMGNITGSNWEKWAAAETGSHGQSGYYNTPTAGDSIWAIAGNTNVKLTSTIGTYNVSDAYTLALDMFYVSGKNGRTRFEVTIGDLILTFVADGSHNLAGSATYDGTAVTFNNNLYLDWNCYSSVTPQTMADELSAAISDAGLSENWIAVSKNYNPNKKTNVQITLADGILTVVSNSLTFTANLTAAGYDKTADLGETEVKLAVELNKENPGSIVGGIGNFTGTYTEVTTGGEGGETPDPEVPTSGTFATLSNMTVETSKYVDSNWFMSCGSGYFYSDYYNSEAMVTSQGRITASSGPYAIGDEFSFSYNVIRDAWPSRDKTLENGSVVPGYLNVVTLGDLRIELSSSNTPFVTVNAYYGNKQIITNAASSAWSDNNYGVEFGSTSDEWKSNFSMERNEDDTAYVGELYNKIPNAANGGQNTYYAAAKKKAEVTVSYSNDVLTITYGKIGATTPYTVTANLTNADFSNASLAISVAEANNRGTMLYGFAGTYTPYVAPAVDPLAPTGVYPTLNSDLTLNVIYANAADYKDTVEVTATVEGMSPKTVGLTEKDGYLVASFDFLTPDKFGSEITLNAVDTNGIAESYSTTYSVKQYCKNMMDKDSSSAELKALCMALLQFGDSYAVYKNGSTFLSDMSSYVTAYAPTAWTQGTAAWTYTGTANGAEWVGANLNFAGEIGINVNFKADGDASDYTVDASFGTVSDVIVDGDTFMATIRISSSFLSNQNEVTVMSADGVISEVFTLSVEDWVNANIGKMEDAKTKAFVIALMTYGDAAAAYRN